MAQLVEHILGKDEVPGSNPGSSSKKALAKASAFLTKSADGGRNPPAVDEIASR